MWSHIVNIVIELGHFLQIGLEVAIGGQFDFVFLNKDIIHIKLPMHGCFGSQIAKTVDNLNQITDGLVGFDRSFLLNELFETAITFLHINLQSIFSLFHFQNPYNII